VLLKQGEGGIEVGSLGKAPPGCGAMGVAASEVVLAAAGDPVQQPAGVLHTWVGAHQVEHCLGVVDQVAGQADGAGEGVAADRAGPAVPEVAGQVQEPSEPAGGAGELGRPPGQVGQVAAVSGQAGLQLALQGQELLPGGLVEDEQGRSGTSVRTPPS